MSNGLLKSSPTRINSVEIVRTRREQGIVFEAFDAFGFDVNDAVDVLQPAFDDEEGFLGDHQALRFE